MPEEKSERKKERLRLAAEEAVDWTDLDSLLGWGKAEKALNETPIIREARPKKRR